MELDKKQFQKLFEEAKSRYQELNQVNVDLAFAKQWFFTMRADIGISSFFRKKRNYSIIVNVRRKEILSKLSQNDIFAWFGHELAHVVEYETMSNKKLRIFVLRYAFDLKFRFNVEKRTNAFACNNGFAYELLDLWKKFICMNISSKKYQQYILKHYAPDWNDIKACAEAGGVSENDYRYLQNFQKSV